MLKRILRLGKTSKGNQEIDEQVVQEAKERQVEGEKQVEKLDEDLKTKSDAIDDILADFVSTAEATEIIGNPKERPQLRKDSEEFVKKFRQQGGQ